MKHFSLKDYFKMAKARGIRLPIQYFFQNHLFDMFNGTDTHFRLEKKFYNYHPRDFDNGVLYMSCLTREIKNALRWVREKTGDSFYDFQFLDLGCGKGKSLIVYSQLCGSKAKHKAIGIEYYKPLLDIAENNLQVTGTSRLVKVVHDDARRFKAYTNTHNLILFLYNPFGEGTLREVLDNCNGMKVVIIYIDPVYDRAIQEAGFRLVHAKKGFYPNGTTNIYSLGDALVKETA